MGVSNTTYKQTELGLIPQDWEVKTFIDVFNFLSTANYSRAELSENGNAYYLHYGDVHTKFQHFVDFEKVELPTIETNKLKGFSLLKDGDLILVDASEDYNGVTKSVEILNVKKNKAISGLHTFLLRDKSQNFINGFKGYITSGIFVQKQFEKFATGMKVFGVSKGNLKQIQIPIPPLAEQAAIANALSDVDNLIESLEKFIEKKKRIKQGALQKLLKPKKGWENKRLGDIGKVYGGLSGKNKKDFETGDKPYIPFMNVMANTIINTNDLCYVNFSSNETQNKVLKNDLIFNGSSETPEEVGMCSVLLHSFPELYLNSFCFGYRLTNTSLHSPLYLSFYFRSSFGRNLIYSLSQGATRYNLSKTNFLNLIIPIPSLEEQEEIADILTDMDNEIELLKSKLHKHQQVKQGMMQNLLTGKIRLL